METEKTVKLKNILFAISAIKLCKCLRDEKKEYILVNQLYKSKTNIGADISENKCAANKKGFIEKTHLASKERVETQSLMELLYEIVSMTAKAINTKIQALSSTLRVYL